jgi:hypothetical protein
MAQFTDNKGTTWNLAITVEAIKRVKTTLAIDLGNVHLGDPPPAARLDTDIVLLIDVIYVLLLPQALAKNISDTEFGESLGGDAALAAREAFWRSLVDFFQKFHRPDAAAAILKQMELVNRMIGVATERISKVDVNETVVSLLNSGAPSTGGLASLESSQVR